MFKPEIFRRLLAMIAAKNCFSVVPIVRIQCFYELKNKANLISGQPKDYKKFEKWDHSDETTPLKQRTKKLKYDINPKRTPRIGLNWIPREQNAISESGSPLWLVYENFSSFQQTLVGEERVTNPKRSPKRVCADCARRLILLWSWSAVASSISWNGVHFFHSALTPLLIKWKVLHIKSNDNRPIFRKYWAAQVRYLFSIACGLIHRYWH